MRHPPLTWIVDGNQRDDEQRLERVEVRHQFREANKVADKLTNLMLDDENNHRKEILFIKKGAAKTSKRANSGAQSLKTPGDRPARPLRRSSQ
ncbi:hypothetical protein PIB30_099553 [Stylosanthes scabra]|uniref:RNase H type-1 domain-containing protein n=1 Tax=Stylosanthes scabra TaxID=79078 RepID=A0ABU6YVS8_9FABA|nr:hypothetical protein [Stylosanthes scabra]